MDFQSILRINIEDQRSTIEFKGETEEQKKKVVEVEWSETPEYPGARGSWTGMHSSANEKPRKKWRMVDRILQY